VAAPPTAEQMEALLAQWSDWLAGHTDAMLSLEERVRTAGSDDDQADLAAAFMGRKAVADRLQEITDLADHDRSKAARLASRPLTDSLGGPVGRNLADAAALVDSIVSRVEQRVSAVERQASSEVALATQADADLSVADALATALGSHANQVAQLRAEFVARRHLGSVAAHAAELRVELEHIDLERRQLLEKWVGLADRLIGLGDSEASVRQLAQRCREKVVQAPVLAVPSVAAVGDLAPAGELAAMPWSAARAAMVPVLEKVERLDAALSEARRRFQRLLDDRDNLRGLLQAFRDKAAAHRLGESGALEPLYRQAESLLWAAPCDLSAARPLVDRYVATVNAMIASAVTPRGAGS
jgi:hypothetical protein